MSEVCPEGAATSEEHLGERREPFEQRAAAARHATKQARLALEAAERSKAFWDVLVGHLAKGELGSILLHLERHRDYVRSLRADDDPISAELESLQNESHAAVVATAKTLGRTFPEAAREAGLVIDSSSRHPRYTFRNGFVRIELDEKRLVAKLQSREGEEREYGLDLELIVGVLRDEISRLFEREFKPEPFLRSLHTAYSAALRAEDLAEGETDRLRCANETEPVENGVGVVAVAGGGADRFREKSDPLVVAQRFVGHAGFGCDLSDAHGPQPTP